jgi:hypothetical protein
LTLRTLLAYMDGLLDPKDSQEIGKKIEDSKYATDLFHKIRDVMRRLRLAAPSITERGTNLDCNTVAEYLDNAMPGDRVPDFEEVSLKSDMHLAEVASCHQILAMVLGEPVEIDPESRQRMYQLPTVANRVDEERQAAVEAATMLSGDGNGPMPPAAPPLKVRPRPVVPEYLRDPPGKSRLLPAAAIMLLAGATIGLLWVLFSANARQWLEARKPSAEESRGEGERPKAARSSDGETAKPSEASAAGGKDTGNTLAVAGKSELPAPTVENPADHSPANPVPIPSKGTGTLAGLTPSGSNVLSPTPPLPMPPPVADHNVKLPDGDVAVVPTAGSPPKSTADAAKAGNPPPAPARVGPSPVPPGNAKLGRFTSDTQDVLLRFEEGSASWRRVLPEEFLAGHQALLALPTYRPRVVVLNAGVALELVNGTRIELLPDNSQGLPGVDIAFGNLVVKPLAQEGARLRVAVRSHSGTITLASGESIAGLEVTRVHDLGKHPEKALSHALTRLYAARGNAIWEEEGKPPVRLSAPARLLLDGDAADALPAADKEVPNWITANTVNELDQRAARDVSLALSADRAASLSLNELSEDRRREVRGLAARCLGYLGQFDPMTAALNDVDLHFKWSDYIQQLKEAIARGPETAASIRQSLEKKYTNDAAALYRMLWGYTDNDLEDGEDARLVKYLDDESPIFRALAFENLKDITGKTLSYQPEATTAAKRLKAVQQWKKLLQLGWIRYNVPDVKPRPVPAEIPKATVPAPPKPLKVDAPDETDPTSALRTNYSLQSAAW